jgi:alpha-ketoglutarate-dependent taurine dioxygenase
MVNYSGNVRNPFVMCAPNPRFQIAALKFDDSLLEVTWQDNHHSLLEGRMFEYQNPIIQTDSDGDVTSVRLLDRALAPVDCALDQVEAFYAALRELLSLNYAGDGLIEFKLHAGEMLVFNNQRLMHGRTAFNPANSKRHIRSCHVDLDEFYSRLRILYAKRQDPRRWMSFRKD